MARKIDPNNLSAGDVVRALAPIVIIVAGLFLASHFFGKTGSLVAIAVIFIGIFVAVARLPKPELHRIDRKMRETDEKMYRVPVIGPLLGPLWKSIDWLSMLLALVGLVFLGYAIGKELF